MNKTRNHSLKALCLSACLLGAPAAKGDTVQVIGNLTGTINWYNTNEYVLNGFVYVLSGGVLNIQPGTVVRGKSGTGLNSAALFITQGAKIFANGTRAQPIIFCSESDDLFDPTDLPIWQRGLWGGIVLYGRSVLNTPSDVNGRNANPKYDLFEGLPDSEVNGQRINRYGGNDDDDSSGVMRYVSIRNSSTVILPDKEINGLSLCAVGRGTKIENIEVVGAADDSVEFFGGTVNTKYMASIFSDDDNFDIDQGYRGKNQFWFALQAPDRKDHGGEWNGEPNGIGVGNTPIGNFEIYNATYIGAGTNTAGGRALISRVYAAPKVLNSIFTEFNIGVNIDDTSAIHFTNGVAKFQNNILWNFGSNGVPVPYGQNAAAAAVLANPANSNLFVDPQLRSISRTNVPAFGLDPRPRAGSPALTSSLTAPDDGFYTPVAYKGAFDANDLWLSDWSFTSQLGLLPSRPALGDPDHTVQVSGNLSGTINWYRTNTYVLNGFVYVLAGGVLNIEPGTVVRGKSGTGLNSAALFITQGAKINANGTPHSPIIFCSEADDLQDPNDLLLWQRGLWGGIVIYGRSVLNTPSDVNGRNANPKYDLFEGLPDTEVNGQRVNRYGGNDDEDNSGVMRYVSIRNSSTVILPDKEINGLSLCAVGRGTTIENIEVVGAADDSVEFFGGTVNTRYMASFFSDDDNFDIDQGYRGKNQFWFALAAPDRKDHGGEWNGEPNGIGVGNTPIGNFEIYNATYIGAGTNTAGGRALISRVYAAPKVFNSIFTEFNLGVNIDDTSAIHFTNGVAKFQHNILWNFASNGVAVPYGQNGAAAAVLSDPANSNQFVDPLLGGISRTNFPAFGLDPRPLPGSPALTSTLTAPDDGFYKPVAYVGAFKDVNWASEWGFAAEAGLITGQGAGVPQSTTSRPRCNPATLSIIHNGDNYEISFSSVAGMTYRLYASSALQQPVGGWTSLDTKVAAGASITFTAPAAGELRFFAVVCETQ
jgi:hypothetical protein